MTPPSTFWSRLSKQSSCGPGVAIAVLLMPLIDQVEIQAH